MANLRKDSPIQSLRNGLIVSCQPRANSTLNHPRFVAALAAAAEEGGAVAVRINGVRNIRAVRQAVQIPIVGIEKMNFPDCPVYITPTIESVRRVHCAGVNLIAIDATERLRPHNQSLADIINASKTELKAVIMADIATLQQGLEAARFGVDLVSTTLYGYTEGTQHCQGPAFTLLRDLVREVGIPVILEGRVHEPDQVRKAFDLGAHAVVVGTAITDFEWLTRRFIEACPHGHGRHSKLAYHKSAPHRAIPSKRARGK